MKRGISQTILPPSSGFYAIVKNTFHLKQNFGLISNFAYILKYSVAEAPDGSGVLAPVFLDSHEELQINFASQHLLDLLAGSGADLL